MVIYGIKLSSHLWILKLGQPDEAFDAIREVMRISMIMHIRLYI